MRKISVSALVLASLMPSACMAADEAQDGPPAANTPSDGNHAMNDTNDDDAPGIADLPFSRGHRFATLDGYLAYLRQYNGPVDMPWWREIRPGVYRYEIRMADGPEPEVATRAQLEQRFGFAQAE